MKKLGIIIRKFNSLLIYLYAYLKGKKKYKNKSNNQKTVLLIFFGKIGDMVMFMDVLTEMKRLYIEEKKYRFVLACRNEVKKTIETVGLQDNITIFEINRERLFPDIRYFIDRVKVADSYSPDIILHIRQNDFCEDVYIHAIQAREKLIYRIFYKKSITRRDKFFNENTYSKDIRADEQKDLLTCYADLMRMLGSNNFHSSIYKMPLMRRPVGFCKDKYVAICPGASLAGKCWPVERYAEVANYILKSTDYKIIFCGGQVERIIAEKIIEQLEDRQKILNLAAQTEMWEWFSIIQNAVFVLSNESAATHISASSRVPNISIGEQTYGCKWLPYRPEIIEKDDVIPVIVRSKRLPCYFCANNVFFADPECIKCFNSTGVYKCVYDITTEMVIREIDKLIK